MCPIPCPALWRRSRPRTMSLARTVSSSVVRSVILGQVPQLLCTRVSFLSDMEDERFSMSVRIRGRYNGSRRPSSDDSPTVIPPSALNKPSIMKRFHHRRTCSASLAQAVSSPVVRTVIFPGSLGQVTQLLCTRVSFLSGRQKIQHVCLLVGWLLNVPATCYCISGTDLHRERSCRSNFLPHPVTVY